MKFLKFFGAFSILALSISCNDTNAIYSPIPVNESVDAPPVTGQFNKNVLLEDYTGTWCGNCTRVAKAIELVEEATNRAVIVAIHNGDDPYHFVNYQPLKDLISPDHDLELPQARLNRTTTWMDPDINTVDAINLTSNNCGLGIAMNSTVTDGQINLDVSVKFAQNYSNLKLVVYLLENGLRHEQTNYSVYYNEVVHIENFEHNHVLRTSLTNLLGDPIYGSDFDQTVVRNFTIPIPANIENAANLSFVAIVTDANNYAINSRAALPNEEQTFQQNP